MSDSGLVPITVSAEPAAGGVVDGDGPYAMNQQVTVTAAPNPGYVFQHWTEADTVVSTSAVYPFAATATRNLVAHFEERDAYTLIYIVGPGGTLVGTSPQTVFQGSSGSSVEAIPDADALFDGWSDGVPGASRWDEHVSEDITVTANFRSEGGVPIEWYDGYGIIRAVDETWADVDSRDIHDKRMPLHKEYVADTNPNVPDDIFRIIEITTDVPPEIVFEPESPARVYTLQYRINLSEGVWNDVPEHIRVPGGERPMTGIMGGEGDLFYRVLVDMP